MTIKQIMDKDEKQHNHKIRMSKIKEELKEKTI
jgi:hypothetical protein